MYVCICNGVTDSQIMNAASNGVSTLQQLSDELNVGTCCGCCKKCAKGLLRQGVQMNKASETEA